MGGPALGGVERVRFFRGDQRFRGGARRGRGTGGWSKKVFDRADHRGRGFRPPVGGPNVGDVLRIRQIAQLYKNGWEIRRLQNDESGRAFRIMIEASRPLPLRNEAARENMGVSARFAPLQVEQYVGHAGVFLPRIRAARLVGRVLAPCDPRGLGIRSPIRAGIYGRAGYVGFADRVGMDGNEQRRVGSAGDSDAIAERDELVANARHDNLEFLARLEPALEL